MSKSSYQIQIIVPRSDWGARPPRSKPVISTVLRRVAIHWSATAGAIDHAKCAAQVRAIQRAHFDRGWNDVGYHFLVCNHGIIFEGRGWGVVGSHCPGYNSTSIGICWIGRGERPVSDDARAAIKYLIAEFEKRYGKPVEIFPHRLKRATECPGPELTRWINGGLKV